MRAIRWLSLFVMVFGLAWWAAGQTSTGAAREANAVQAGARGPATPNFEMQIPSFPDGGDYPVKYSDSGERINPAITWTNPPKGTVTFFLQLHDENTARNKTTEDNLDWMLWNIPASATGLPEGVPAVAQLPDGAQQTSAAGPGIYRAPGFTGGPDRKAAKHHYTFDLYALDIKLDIPNAGDAFAIRAAIFKAIQGHVLGKAVYMGLFRRPPGPLPPGSR